MSSCRATNANAESVAANEAVEPTKDATRRRIYTMAIACGPYGITADELAEAWGVSHNHVAPRVTELKISGLLLDSGRRRRTRSGCSASVLIAVPEKKARAA